MHQTVKKSETGHSNQTVMYPITEAPQLAPLMQHFLLGDPAYTLESVVHCSADRCVVIERIMYDNWGTGFHNCCCGWPFKSRAPTMT